MGLDNPSQVLRQQVAEYILNHPQEYNSVILGEDPVRYTTRMKQMDTWGGAIELSILSDIYSIEISSIDVKASPPPPPPLKTPPPLTPPSPSASTASARERTAASSSSTRASTTTASPSAWT